MNLNLPTQPTNIFLRFDPTLITNGRLEAIVKYNGDIESILDSVESVEILNGSFAKTIDIPLTPPVAKPFGALKK